MPRHRLHTFACALLLYAGVSAPALAEFGFTRSGDRVIVDSGAELVFSVANSTLIRNAVEDLLGEDFEGRFE
ncbi:hypothetical protein, partial [Xanthomonas oryzae]|uniref:hypothetical protein n=1 Tax=Xanthomonas oryzae TaxID=347 RepID=UPI00117FB9C7